MIKVAPSILSADFSRLADELKKVIESNGFLARIEPKYRGFGAMWERWKAKFLK